MPTMGAEPEWRNTLIISQCLGTSQSSFDPLLPVVGVRHPEA